MKRLLLALALVPSLALAQKPAAAPAAAPAAGAAPAKMEPPKPAAELDNLKPLLGTWNCEGKAPASPMGPAHDFKSTNTFKLDLDNFWVSHSREVKKSKEMPMGFMGKGWSGWDGSAKKLVFAGADNHGGWISLTSAGWAGDNMAFEGDAFGMMGKRKVKLTFMKGKTPNEVNVEFMMADDKGAMGAPMTESCKKGK
jgi:hypothetical protein